mgnify:CR=1 FL=1|tara:strand:- start:8868 stop:9191 length:324 start_codon:yes stop_codon:yes gene_type:complete
MSKYNKVTYCRSCGASNNWNLEKKTSLLKKPKFCSSCRSDLITGKVIEKRRGKSEKVEEKDFVMPTNIPPLEIDIGASYFPKLDSQSLGNLVSPSFKEDEEQSTDVN